MAGRLLERSAAFRLEPRIARGLTLGVSLLSDAKCSTPSRAIAGEGVADERWSAGCGGLPRGRALRVNRGLGGEARGAESIALERAPVEGPRGTGAAREMFEGSGASRPLDRYEVPRVGIVTGRRVPRPALYRKAPG